jgi:arylsulfatase A-like enzyme
VELIDLGPTFLELAGLEPLEDASGQSLCPLLDGRDEVVHEVVFSEYGPRVMARTHDWKLVFYPGQTYGELYDMNTDSDELYNRYDDPAYTEAQRQMVERLLHWYASTRMRAK